MYALSFVFLGIYWNNHHHMLQMTETVNGKIQWANLHLLFWLSLVPFVTRWMGENHFAALPTAIYGGVFPASAIAYTILQSAIIAQQGPTSRLAAVVGGDRKGKISGVMYAVAIVVAFFNRWISDAIYVSVALIWLVPDPRIESALRRDQRNEAG
jgi:uncharacterized membrane protein